MTSAERISATSRDGLVEVTVDGDGSVVEVRLDPDLLVTAGPHQVGSSAVEAIAAARAGASRRAADDEEPVR